MLARLLCLCMALGMLPLVTSGQSRNNETFVAPEHRLSFVDAPNKVLSFGVPFPFYRIPVKMEWAAGSNTSMGFHAKAYIWPTLSQGIIVEPFYRHYFSGLAPKGGYLQLKIAGGYFRNNDMIETGEVCSYSGGSYVCFSSYADNYAVIGGGFNGGYQFMGGQNGKFAADLFGGFHWYYVVDGTLDGNLLFNLRELFGLDFGVRLGFGW